MQQFFESLLSNRMLVAALIGWSVAQLLKTLIHLIVYREWKAERLVGSGGMPSSHSATVCAMTVTAFLHYGIESPIFALSFILAAVVLHDARGVRLETGKQADVIAEIASFIEEREKKELFGQDDLKRLVGHTPLQVLVGSLLGIVIGIFGG